MNARLHFLPHMSILCLGLLLMAPVKLKSVCQYHRQQRLRWRRLVASTIMTMCHLLCGISMMLQFIRTMLKLLVVAALTIRRKDVKPPWHRHPLN